MKFPPSLIDVLQDGSKSAPKAPKSAPRGPQEAPRRPQEASKRRTRDPQETPKRLQEDSRGTRDASQTFQKASKKTRKRHPRRLLCSSCFLILFILPPSSPFPFSSSTSSCSSSSSSYLSCSSLSSSSFSSSPSFSYFSAILSLLRLRRRLKLLFPCMLLHFPDRGNSPGYRLWMASGRRFCMGRWLVFFF